MAIIYYCEEPSGECRRYENILLWCIIGLPCLIRLWAKSCSHNQAPILSPMTARVVHVIRRIRCSPACRFSGQWRPISRHITRSRSQTVIDCVTDDPIWRSVLFQSGASVAEGCSALNQHWVLDTNSGAFQMLQINIELTVWMHQTRKVDAMLF